MWWRYHNDVIPILFTYWISILNNLICTDYNYITCNYIMREHLKVSNALMHNLCAVQVRAINANTLEHIFNFTIWLINKCHSILVTVKKKVHNITCAEDHDWSLYWWQYMFILIVSVTTKHCHWHYHNQVINWQNFHCHHYCW